MIFRKLLALCATVFVVAASQPAHALVSEFDDCANIPVEVIFRKEPHGYYPVDVVKRFERYAGGSFVQMPKNPEQVMTHGALHGRNCSPGAYAGGTQVLTFKMKTTNYFGNYGFPSSGVADHFPILMRGHLFRQDYTPGGTHNGRGLAMFRPAALSGKSAPWIDINVENFTNGTLNAIPNTDTGGYPFYVEDGKWYTFSLHVHQYGIAWWITDDINGRLMHGYFGDPGPLAVEDGYAFGALCIDADRSCNSVANFEVHIKDFNVSWF